MGFGRIPLYDNGVLYGGEGKPARYRDSSGYIYEQDAFGEWVMIGQGYDGLSYTLIPEAPKVAASNWSKVRAAIAGYGATFETFESYEEAERKAKQLAGATGSTQEVTIFKAVSVARPVPKEVELVPIDSDETERSRKEGR